MPDSLRIEDIDFNANVLSHEEIDEYCLRVAAIRSSIFEDRRRRYCRELIRDYIGTDVDENFFETYSRLVSDENDENFMTGELTKIFGNRQVAKYLITILMPDYTRTLLLLIMSHPDKHPILVLGSFCTDFHYITESVLRDVFRIYDGRINELEFFLV